MRRAKGRVVPTVVKGVVVVVTKKALISFPVRGEPVEP